MDTTYGRPLVYLKSPWNTTNLFRLGRASFDLPPIDIILPSDSGHIIQGSDEQSTAPHAVLHRSASATHLPQPPSLLPITIIPPSNDNGDSDSIHTVRHSNEKNDKSDKEENHGTRKKKAHQIIKEQVNKRQSQIQTTISKRLGRSSTLRSQMSRASSSPG
jgi:hypothetical protein